MLTDGNDLLLNTRMEGAFLEPMELKTFPADVQMLHIHMVLNCRNEGQMAVDLEVDGKAETHVDVTGFYLHHGFKLLHEGRAECHSYTHVGGTKRTFPAIVAVFAVRRRPAFYVMNIAMPMALFSGLSLLQFLVDREDAASRLSITLALLLTAAVYQSTAASMTPSISYMTALDRYVAFNALLRECLLTERNGRTRARQGTNKKGWRAPGERFASTLPHPRPSTTLPVLSHSNPSRVRAPLSNRAFLQWRWLPSSVR